MSKFVSGVVTCLGYLFFVGIVLAQAPVPLSPPPGSINPDIRAENIPQFVINLLFGVAMFLAVAYLMFGGIKWITSRGDKVGVETARRHIMAAVIGLVIVIGTFFILQVLFTVLGAQNPLKNGFQLPTLK